jgi:hypothetical protein
LRVHLNDWLEHRDQRRPAEPSPEPEAVATPAPSPASTEPVAADKTKKRATKRATPETYAEHQPAHIEQTGEYASQSDDEAWAQAKGCSARHTRDVLRQQFYEALPPSEQVRFRSRGKKGKPDALKR